MFNKNTFGQTPASSSFSTFNPQQQQNTGFGQSAFSKPGGAFGTSFGQQNTSVFGAQPATATSLFGATNPTQQQGFGSKINFPITFCSYFIISKFLRFWATTTAATANFHLRHDQHNWIIVIIRSSTEFNIRSC